MISDRLRCIFVHIPKCGGSSFESALWKADEHTVDNLFGGLTERYRNPYQSGGLQHLTALKIRQVVGREKFDSYYKFAIVRNPFAKAVSQFNFSRQSRYFRKFIGLKVSDDFKTYLRKIHLKTHVQWAPQVSFVYDHRGRKLVDYVGRFEEIHEAFDHVCNELDVTADLPHKKKSVVKAPYQSYFDAESIAYVKEMYADDLEVFGYSFDPL